MNVSEINYVNVRHERYQNIDASSRTKPNEKLIAFKIGRTQKITK